MGQAVDEGVYRQAALPYGSGGVAKSPPYKDEAVAPSSLPRGKAGPALIKGRDFSAYSARGFCMGARPCGPRV